MGGGVSPVIIELNQRKARLSLAEAAKTLVHSHAHGVLSTLGTDGGFPFGSVIDYVACDNGDVVTLLSRHAEHFRFLQADPKASLLINPLLCEHDARSSPRVTLQGEARQSAKTDDWIGIYLERHPNADEYIHREDMVLFHLEVSSVRYIAGEGKVGWLDPEQYLNAQPDPLGNHAQWLSYFLTEEYAPQLAAVARHLYGIRGSRECAVLHIDRYGFDMTCRGEDDSKSLRINFGKPVSDETAFMRAARRLFARAKEASPVRPVRQL